MEFQSTWKNTFAEESTDGELDEDFPITIQLNRISKSGYLS